MNEGIDTANLDPVLDPQPGTNSLLADLFAYFANFFALLGAGFERLFSLFKKKD